MLNEGWDISNVYVICPLRQMNSITLIEQVMGRGLRLPFGHRTQVPMIDELDVVCFGRQTVQDLANEAINAGYGGSSISVVEKGKATKPQPTIEYMLKHKKQPDAPLELTFPRVKRKQPEIDVGAVSLPPPTSSDLHGFDISDPQTVKRIAEIPKLTLEEFVSTTASSVIKNCKFLSASKDRPKVDGLVSRLVRGNADEKGQVSLSPAILCRIYQVTFGYDIQRYPANLRSNQTYRQDRFVRCGHKGCQAGQCSRRGYYWF